MSNLRKRTFDRPTESTLRSCLFSFLKHLHNAKWIGQGLPNGLVRDWPIDRKQDGAEIRLYERKEKGEVALSLENELVTHTDF